MANEQNLKHFKKGQSGNPKGRPSVRKELQRQGLNKQEAFNAIGMLLQCNRGELVKIAEDKEEQVYKTSIARAILKDIATGKISTVDSIFDRLFGRAKQSISADVEGDINIKLVE